MRIAFYRAAAGTIIDKAINQFSGRLGFSHVELVFSDGMFFSSSPRDGGVRFAMIAPDPAHWLTLELSLTAADEAAVRAFCNTQNGKKYDWLGVFGFVLPTKPDQSRWFCSEICVAAMQAAGYLNIVPPNKVSPSDLYLILESAGKPITARI